MAIYRVVPNLQTDRVDDNRAFYVDFLGFDQLMNLGWIATYGAPEMPTAQISVIERDATALMLADISIEVDDADAYHAEATRRGVEIVYGPVDEPWGVRRFFVRDPNGKIINIVAHSARS